MKNLPLLNVPFGPVGGIEELADGYYRIEMPAGGISQQNPSAWVVSPAVHDGNVGAGYQTGNQGSATARIAILAAKAAGMAIDEVTYQHGYANAGSAEDMLGAQSIGGLWTPLDFGAFTGMIDHLGTFSFAAQIASGASGVPYRYVALILADSGGTNNEAGCADIRWKASGVDVGP